MQKIRVYMKSGNIITFECEELSVKKDGFGVIIELNWKNGDSKLRLIQMDLSKIEGITTENLEEVN